MPFLPTFYIVLYGGGGFPSFFSILDKKGYLTSITKANTKLEFEHMVIPPLFQSRTILTKWENTNMFARSPPQIGNLRKHNGIWFDTQSCWPIGLAIGRLWKRSQRSTILTFFFLSQETPIKYRYHAFKAFGRLTCTLYIKHPNAKMVRSPTNMDRSPKDPNGQIAQQSEATLKSQT